MKTVELNLRNAKIAREGKLVEGGIAIDRGKIHSISKGPSLPQAEEEIDLEGSLLLPGVVDPHVHFREPGRTHKEDFYTGSSAAAAGGVTTICDMPNTIPPTDSAEELEKKRRLGEKKSLVDFGLHGMLTDSMEKNNSLLEAGAASLKLYPEKTDDSVVKELDDEEMTITVHPEDPRMTINDFKGDNPDDFLSSRPRKAEASEIERILKTAKGPRVHFCHVTTSESLETVSEKKENRAVTCEVTPHHLILNRTHMEESPTITKVNPPLRTEKDRKRLITGLEKGNIDIIATDHAPHTSEEKGKGLKEAPPGIVGVETSLPLMFTLFNENNIPLSRLVETMCTVPAKIFGLENEDGIGKGVIKEGADADLVALDQDENWKISGEELHGRPSSRPSKGWKSLENLFLRW